MAKIAFISLWDAGKRNVESGYSFSMRNQLARHFDVVDLFPLALRGEALFLPLRALYKASGKYYHPMREPSLLKALARPIGRFLADTRPDAIFSPSSLPLSYVETDIPWAFCSDQLFCDFAETYVRQPAGRFLRLGDAQEARALAAASLASFPSASSVRKAVEYYGVSAEKVHAIPWGGNLPHQIEESAVEAAIEARPFDRCQLVFLGRDWKRKGGEALVATVAELNRQGVQTHATIIGCEPPGLDTDHFTVYPFLDKGRIDHFELFSTVLFSSHFLFHPSRAEAYGQALCEAAAFGVPTIGSMAGGIPTIVRDGETGYLRPYDAPASEFSALIGNSLAEPVRYRTMARAARLDYRQRLNWDSFGDRLATSIKSFC